VSGPNYNSSGPGTGDNIDDIDLVVDFSSFLAPCPTTISINNIPGSATYGGSFLPTYDYAGDGVKSVTSSTLTKCTVSGGTVNFVGGRDGVNRALPVLLSHGAAVAI